jgi:hypothetical protein
MVPIPWPSARTSPTCAWQPPAGTRIISADDHIVEPVHPRAERLPAADRDRAPQFWQDEFGYHLVVDGRSFDTLGDTLGLNSLLVKSFLNVLGEEKAKLVVGGAAARLYGI